MREMLSAVAAPLTIVCRRSLSADVSDPSLEFSHANPGAQFLLPHLVILARHDLRLERLLHLADSAELEGLRSPWPPSADEGIRCARCRPPSAVPAPVRGQ